MEIASNWLRPDRLGPEAGDSETESCEQAYNVHCIIRAGFTHGQDPVELKWPDAVHQPVRCIVLFPVRIESQAPAIINLVIQVNPRFSA